MWLPPAEAKLTSVPAVHEDLAVRALPRTESLPLALGHVGFGILQRHCEGVNGQGGGGGGEC